MNTQILLYLAILILVAMFGGKVVHKIHFPNVTGYLLAGLILGPYVLNIIPIEAINATTIISEVALAFIAFSIGTEFKISYFKKVGKAPVVIAFFEATFAIIVVFITLFILGYPTHEALLLGAIASATAPAATIMVIDQYKAKGPLTSTLLSVVAIDDAIAIIAFGFAVTIVKCISLEHTLTLLDIFFPFYEIGISFLLGIVLGYLFKIPFYWFKKRASYLSISICFIFLATAIAEKIQGSSLLVCMIMGATIVNTFSKADIAVNMIDTIVPPIYIAFFAFSGAQLNISVLSSIGVIGIAYISARVVGKVLGSMIGAKVVNSSIVVQKYIGLTLIPQAGVAIGLSTIAEKVLPEYAIVIRTVVLCATFIYEMIGPVLAKVALQKAGEI